MVIRNAKVEDARGIAHVHVQSWKTTYRGIVPQTYLDGLDETTRTERWVKIITEVNNTKVATNDEGKVVGFVNYGRSERYAADGQVYALYLLESHQRRGIGAELLEAAKTEFQREGWHTYAVEALVDNPSMAFYRNNHPVHYLLSSFTIHGKVLREWVMTFNV
ncbi:GNAT family N-acetyltransferase [Geomicrobium sp. JCM 19039]|uniref:GNAT family N-acetyltransferase n=1 Tax=Geomicrobium sp. JCM 19039 TaxID=1460636 RepID=UPI00045F15EE|nr:GNAT family N-acetyltransferase [Geomicrobium sp. JCM 19039]GAK10679.1 GCN5-related N-acetyltransferase [Geomicrobium sp. JCM 19039]